MHILDDIVRDRKKRINTEGHHMGATLPPSRTLPLVSPATPLVICEIKRSSPSRGWIAPGIDAATHTYNYYRKGIRNISVLTEQDHFCGSLDDLYRVKKRFPNAFILRKDFILDPEDLRTSFLAGADGVLLIASLHSTEVLKQLYAQATGMGMEVLLEVHTREDLKKAAAVKPRYTGFNSRDLTTFAVDPAGPLRLISSITWPTSAVYESGITSKEQAHLAFSSGFSGILAGESAVKNPSLIDGILESASAGKNDFWVRLFSRKTPGRPLVKVCGITRKEDALLAARMGADILGFIFAPSPRKINPEFVRTTGDLDILKIGVVCMDSQDRKLPSEITTLLNEGLLSAVQFHGEELPWSCFRMAFPYYKALRIRETGDIERMSEYRSPRILVDAFSTSAKGGTGKRIPHKLVTKIKQNHPLWLAGGVGPHNVEKIITQYSPELIDASSLLEHSAGRKDPRKMEAFFEKINSSISTETCNVF
ncbi:MAG: bifunctional indole-3-glycerol phosphate synthase/phosphoribosylanthranilate isomerase [Spirochaetota bacterium]